MSVKPLSVSEFLSQIKSLMESHFRLCVIEGEISNLSASSAGHWYFTLSDKESSVSVALFRGDAMRNPLIKKLKDGDKIICTGPVGVYTKRGTFQIICKTLYPLGMGDLKIKFEALKKKLAEEGLFDLERKKSIPPMAKRIAVITASGSAALQDFLNVYKRRSLWMDIVVIPSIVQGEQAPMSIIKAIRLAKAKGNFDVLVITRGGGSLEDLWAFNDEGLAREIADCPIPIISAVGHEVDYSICDFVSDLRVETPTAAAQYLTDAHIQLRDRMLRIEKSLESLMHKKLSYVKDIVHRGHPLHLIEILRDKIRAFKQRLGVLDLKNRLYELTGIHEIYFRLDDSINSLKLIVDNKLKDRKHKMDKNHELLKAYNPQNILKRGYSYVSLGDAVITSKEKLLATTHDEIFNLNFHDGGVPVRRDRD